MSDKPQKGKIIVIPELLYRDPDRSPPAKLAYGRCRSWQGDGFDCYASMPKLAKEIGVSESTAKRAMDELIATGWIHVTESAPGHPKRFRVLKKPRQNPCQVEGGTPVKLTPPTPVKLTPPTPVKLTENPCQIDTQKEEKRRSEKEDLKKSSPTPSFSKARMLKQVAPRKSVAEQLREFEEQERKRREIRGLADHQKAETTSGEYNAWQKAHIE